MVNVNASLCDSLVHFGGRNHVTQVDVVLEWKLMQLPIIRSLMTLLSLSIMATSLSPQGGMFFNRVGSVLCSLSLSEAGGACKK